MPQPKHNKPPLKVRAKVGRVVRRDGRLALAATYLAGQAASPQGAAVAAEAATLKAAVATVIAKLASRTSIHGTLVNASLEVSAAVVALVAAITGYAHAAAAVAGEDAAVLASLGVQAVAARSAHQGGPVGIPTELVVHPGLTPGEAIAKCHTVAGAGAYVFQYKLEPSLPADPWLSPPSASTKYAQCTLVGLAVEQQIRVRASAIGEAQGPWSGEVVGRAK